MSTYARPELLLLRQDVDAHDRRLDSLEEGQGRVLREYADLAKVTKTLADQVSKLTQETNQLALGLRQAGRRMDSHEDLVQANNIKPVLQRVGGTIAAIACFASAKFAPEFAPYLVPAGVGLLTWMHAPRPGDATKEGTKP